MSKVLKRFDVKNLLTIPGAMTESRQWVLWGTDKEPYQAKNPDQLASSTDPSTWATFDEAVKAFKKSTNGRIMGIGYVVTGSPHTGIDLDGCRNRETGGITPEAQEIIDLMKSYTEVTPSGEGVRIFVQGKLPKGIKGARNGIEIYSQGRYFTVTGEIVPPRRDVKLRNIELEQIYQKHFGNRTASIGDPLSIPANCGKSYFTDAEAIEKATHHYKYSAEVQALWNGDDTIYGNDESDGDYHFCKHFAFWTNRDPEAMERMFLQSERAKRDKVRKRGAEYIRRTIYSAIRNSREVYTPPKLKHEGEVMGNGNRYSLSTEDLTTKWGDAKTLKQILAEPQTEEDYLVEPILAKGDKGYVVSPYKTGKTLLLQQLSLCLAMGRPFLDLEVKQPHKVLYIRFELKDHRFNKRLSPMIYGLGGDHLIKVDPAFKLVRGFDFLNPQHYDWLRRQIDQQKPDILILDPLYKMAHFDLKDTSNTMPFLIRLDQLREAYPDLLILMAHHPKKQSADDVGNSWDSTYGPMFFFADMDFEIRLKVSRKDDPIYTLDYISNDIPIPDLTFKRDPVSLLYIPYDMEKEKAIKEVSEMDRVRQEVIDFIREHPLCRTEEIYSTVKPERKVRKVLSELEDQGQITYRGSKRSKVKGMGWVLAGTDAPAEGRAYQESWLSRCCVVPHTPIMGCVSEQHHTRLLKQREKCVATT